MTVRFIGRNVAPGRACRRWSASRILLDIVPDDDMARVVAYHVQGIQKYPLALAESYLDARLHHLRRRVPLGPRLAHQRVEGWQCITVVHQCLDADVHDIDQIVLSQCRVRQCLLQQ